MSCYYADLVEEAAALWESLAQGHPFIDGNKRTAFACAYTFLSINGARITADPLATYVFINGLYEAQDFAFDNLVVWLRNNVTLSSQSESRRLAPCPNPSRPRPSYPITPYPTGRLFGWRFSRHFVPGKASLERTVP